MIDNSLRVGIDKSVTCGILEVNRKMWGLNMETKLNKGVPIPPVRLFLMEGIK